MRRYLFLIFLSTSVHAQSDRVEVARVKRKISDAKVGDTFVLEKSVTLNLSRNDNDDGDEMTKVASGISDDCAVMISNSKKKNNVRLTTGLRWKVVGYKSARQAEMRRARDEGDDEGYKKAQEREDEVSVTLVSSNLSPKRRMIVTCNGDKILQNFRIVSPPQRIEVLKPTIPEKVDSPEGGVR